jgi:hypothetical protein
MPKPDIKTLEKQLARMQEKITRIQSQIKTARKCDSALPLKQVASMLHVCPATVRRMIDAGTLKGFQNGASRSSWWWVTKRSITHLHKKIKYSGPIHPSTDI